MLWGEGKKGEGEGDRVEREGKEKKRRKERGKGSREARKIVWGGVWRGEGRGAVVGSGRGRENDTSPH